MTASARATTFAWDSGGVLRPLRRSASLTDAQASLPDGSYTTFRTYGGRGIVRLDQHRRRLLESVDLSGKDALLPLDVVRRAVSAALDATGHTESRVRLTFAPPAIYLSVEPLSPIPRELRQNGVACITLQLRRDRPHAKDTRFVLTAAQLGLGLPTGIHEALMVDSDDSILEGLTSNFFALLDGTLHSEAERALLGITRSLVLEVSSEVTAIQETAIRRADVPRVSECFITSVSREVLPVTRIDGVAVGTGRPGPLTAQIAHRFALLVSRETEAL